MHNEVIKENFMGLEDDTVTRLSYVGTSDITNHIPFLLDLPLHYVIIEIEEVMNSWGQN